MKLWHNRFLFLFIPVHFNQLILQAAQRASVTFAMANNVLHRLSNEEVSRESSISEYNKLKQSHDALLKENEELRLEKEKLHQSYHALTEEKGKLQRDYNLLKESSHFHQKERDEYLEKYSISSKKFDALLEEHKKLVEENDQKLHAIKKGHEAETKSIKDGFEATKISLVENAIRDYRQSEECYDLKAKYGTGFIKIGFYKARHLLENLKKESFPELFYTEEIEKAEPPN